MSLNFIKTTAVTLFLSSSLAAAGTMGAVETSNPYNKFYIEGDAGWASSNWRDSLNYIFPSQTSTQFSKLNSGFAYGGDIGYNLNRYFSIEAGAFGLPKVGYTIQSATTTYTANDSGTISNWLIDIAGKATLPIEQISGLDLFGKFGIAYRAGNFTDTDIFNGVANTVIQPSVFDLLEPIVGGGLQYHINQRWSINAQYLFVPYGILSTTILGPNQADHISIPSAQILTGGISFNF